jgi:hypothetical protein
MDHLIIGGKSICLKGNGGTVGYFFNWNLVLSENGFTANVAEQA